MPSESDRSDPSRRAASLYLLAAGFLAGSFAGAAFGVFFALSFSPGAWGSGSAVRNAPVTARPASDEDAQVIAAVKKVSPSVVSIAVLKDVSKLYDQNGATLPFQEFFGFSVPQAPGGGAKTPQEQQVAGGSGFIIGADGLILTNRHVVADQDADYEVVMQEGKRYKATVLARDVVLDLAVMKIEAKDLTAAELGDSDKLEPGQTVIAIGNSLSEYQNSVTKGVVSGINRRVVAGGVQGGGEVIEEAIQTDAAINPGNSGGPLVDLRGRVVGMNTAVNQQGQSIGFAIPINAAKIVVDSVKATGRIVRPWLGIRYVLITDDIAAADRLTVNEGALVARGATADEPAVVPGSPADKAGILENDVITDVDGARVDVEHSLSSLVAKKRAGDALTLKILRKGVGKTLQVTLGELPQNLK